MYNFLVLSRQHHLLPFAHQLQSEGHSVEAIVYNPGNRGKYEGAYAGVIKLTLLQGGKNRHKTLEALKEIAAEGNAIVLTDDQRAARDFRAAKTIFSQVKIEKEPSGAVRLGAWFDGELLWAPHLLVVDEGAYPGGIGVHVDTGLTLVRLEELHQLATLMREEIDGLKSRNFRGLCQWGLNLSPSREITLSDDTVFGWPRLHMHAFASELEDFGAVLAKTNLPIVAIKKKYTVVVAVTKPPWPYPVMHPPGQFQIEGLTDDQNGQIYWHDVAVDQESRTIFTAGLDGMVGVTRGSAGSFELAQAQALSLAATLQFPEKQYRSDVGGNVRKALAVLEEQFGIEV